MLSDKTTDAELVQIKPKSESRCQFFETPMVKYQLDAILSINNNNSGHAAAVTTLPYDPWVTKQQENHGDLPYSQTLSSALLKKWVLPLKKQQNQKITERL
jgi:hypothetical protein